MNQSSNWVVVFKHPEAYKIVLAKGLLEGAGIPVRDISKRDSSYNFGQAQIEVPAEFQGRAREIILESSL